jgi:A/G-specific adenine glycosylase
MERLCHLNEEWALSPDGVAAFRQIIYRHFQRHGRDFPWRRTDNPYQIIVSEIMLQQTQVERVARWYGPFLTAFRTWRPWLKPPFKQYSLSGKD